MLLGAHLSIAGGYVNALIKAQELGVDAVQIFTKNQRFWREKIIDESESDSFKSALKKSGVKAIFSHGIYLMNLASDDKNIRENSIISLTSEVTRCNALGLSHTLFHPGAAKELTEKTAVKKIAEALRIVVKATEEMETGILLENTAGQGSSIGWKMEQLSEIIKQTGSERIGICIDTCHAFAAGYDIRTVTGIEDLLSEIDSSMGINKLRTFHLNDSKGVLGSRVDRHEHIGIGQIGIVPFEYIMNNFLHVPKVLETPKENDMDRKNLELLRGLVRKKKK